MPSKPAFTHAVCTAWHATCSRSDCARASLCSMARAWEWRTGSRASALCSASVRAQRRLRRPLPAARRPGGGRARSSSRAAVRCCQPAAHPSLPCQPGLPALSPHQAIWHAMSRQPPLHIRAVLTFGQGVPGCQLVTECDCTALQTTITKYMPGRRRGQQMLSPILESAAEEGTEESAATRRNARGRVSKARAGEGLQRMHSVSSVHGPCVAA